MIVKLLEYTRNADAICAAAGKSCYSERPSADLLEESDSDKILDMIIGMGHFSVVEHASFTFSVEGVSRSLTHQLVRHRIASFSQQSQRYVSLEEANYVIPETIVADPVCKEIYENLMNDVWRIYNRLCETVPTEDARYVLPNGCMTNITITMNARELLHFLSLRCCNRAQWEIRELADQMLVLCREVSPIIFKNAGAPCIRGPCPEGKFTCGHPRNANKV